MLAQLAAMAQNVGVGAAGFFEGVGQDWQPVEVAIVIDRLRHLADNAVVPDEPENLHQA